jgi:hypothetical protein
MAKAFTHRGPWDTHSRLSPALSFLEQYYQTIDSLSLSSIPSSKFYAQDAIFRDAKGDISFSGPNIWGCMQRNLSTFEKIQHEVVECRVIEEEQEQEQEEERRCVVYAEFLTHFRFKGDGDEVVVPRFFVFGIRDEGKGGLRIDEVRLFWDTGVLARFVTEKNRRGKRRRGSDGD